MTNARPLDKLAAGAAFVLGLITIAGALASQYLGGLQPCELCLEQRLPYYWGLPLLALVLILWNRLPLPVWYVAMAIVTALFAWGTYLGGFHSGVEWGLARPDRLLRHWRRWRPNPRFAERSPAGHWLRCRSVPFPRHFAGRL